MVRKLVALNQNSGKLYVANHMLDSLGQVDINH